MKQYRYQEGELNVKRIWHRIFNHPSTQLVRTRMNLTWWIFDCECGDSFLEERTLEESAEMEAGCEGLCTGGGCSACPGHAA